MNAKCHGTASGFIKTRANGGEKPYTFQWSNGGTSDEIDQLMAGTYTVTITDARLFLYRSSQHFATFRNYSGSSQLPSYL
ncbi:MAG: SprB repeat-containing protein [Bacteroidetes bacterium]|nr:SprB repeat-containing protein [Bacteroidota bacterium]